MMNKPGATGLTRIRHACGYSVKGLRAAFLSEAAFRQEVYALPIVLGLAIWLANTGIEFALLFGSFGLILVAELINSALEAVVDRIGPEHHPLSGQAKDIGSAIVMVAMILMAVTWVAVLVFR
ncbi:diacylglycerol kinase [Wohlfahrtiimonas chitiniclastica]|uniref:Diacylglycerol kinase n=1 Tax=Wohlfahrtiimonas chitiniclastica TaxID=400946 RepID=A0AB35C186_9GAMM|nr:diacylglycerol kinase [Wohlfahrtiimonas chitiniclastica]MBS7824565.1 diacylglycerol kinase [Wohlfahrtiimonas chitiniclastica]MBS7840028.1 diacylglycerol kinase [Wohlfahrtiimonas chitiniclastica]OYQ88978.1 diacylglycerol kinase [Wohlfahrtiimonas chitiniclastica]